MPRSGGRGPGKTKTPAARGGAGVRNDGFLFSQRRRCLHPPCRSSGRRSFLCCAFLLCADSLASAATSVGRNLITVFSTVNTPHRNSFRSPAAAAPVRSGLAARTIATIVRNERRWRARAANESAENKCVFKNPTAIANMRGASASRWTTRAARARRRSGPRKKNGGRASDFAPHKPVCAETAQTFRPRRRRPPASSTHAEDARRVMRRDESRSAYGAGEGSGRSASRVAATLADGARCSVRAMVAADAPGAPAAGRLSGRLPRATRRSRPGQAGR